MAIFDDISAQFNGATTAFVLTVSGQTVDLSGTRDLDIMVGGVGRFENTDYTIVGNQIIFSSAPIAGDLFAGEYSFPEQTGFATTTELNSLSDVVDTKADVSTVASELSGKADKLAFNAALVDFGGKLDADALPVNVSAFSNDAEYVTQDALTAAVSTSEQSTRANAEDAEAARDAAQTSEMLASGYAEQAETAASNVIFATLSQDLATNSYDINFGDNDKANFGTSDDLQIYHDESNNSSYIKETGVGSFNIEATNLFLKREGGTESFIDCVTNGAVTTYYNGLAKLATTATGIDVTGDISVSDISPSISLMESDTTDLNTFLASTAGDFTIYTRTDAGINSKQRLNIDHATGDISFYEDTGTTPKLFWDASAEQLTSGKTILTHSNSNNSAVVTSTTGNLELRGSEDDYYQLFLKDGGKVGIGTSSPATTLDVNGDITLSNTLHLTNASTSSFMQVSSNILQLGTSSADPVAFYSGNSERMRIGATGDITQTGGDYIYSGGINWDLKHTGAGQNIAFSTTPTGGSATERMRIKSDGNVGIGTTNPQAILDVNGGYINLADGTYSASMGRGNSLISGQTASDFVIAANGSTDLVLSTGSADRLHIDSSGNVLVGTTSTVPQEGTHGFVARANGYTIASADDARVMLVNRGTSDGELINFRKDNTPVGSISSYAGTRLAIGSNGVSGAVFGQNAVIPATSGTTVVTDAYDLGTASYNWKDLYLSGGVHLGGTGTANKLDDYEEGTWTPTLYAATTGTNRVTSIVSATYTKIGRLVRCKAYLSVINGTALNGDSGAIQLGGLPFTSSAYGHLRTLYSNLSSSSITGIVTGTVVGLRVGDSQAVLQPSNINTGSNNIMIDVTFEV